MGSAEDLLVILVPRGSREAVIPTCCMDKPLIVEKDIVTRRQNGSDGSRSSFLSHSEPPGTEQKNSGCVFCQIHCRMSDRSNGENPVGMLMVIPDRLFFLFSQKKESAGRKGRMRAACRSIKWCEQKIVQVLSRNRQIVTHLALEAHVLQEVRSTQEDRHFHRALTNLLNGNIVRQEKTQDGFPVFRLVK